MPRLIRLVPLSLLFAAVLSFMCLDSAAARTVLTPDDLRDFLGRFLPHQLKRSAIPGAVVVVVKDGKVMMAEGYGVANVETHRPMTADRTLINVASIKKLFEGIAIMQLVEQRRVNLDRDVSTYLDFTIPTPEDGVPVTLRRLMTHRAGFEDVFKTSNRSFAERLPRRLFPYGDVPAYSNYGASLSGYILARVSGKTTSDYVTQQVLSPLGMTRSSFAVRPPPALAPLMATGYLVKPGSPLAPLDVQYTDLQLSATGDDMGRFLRAVLNGGLLDGHRILRRETLATMTSPQVTEPLSVMGLYFYQREIGGVRFMGHRGDTSVFQSDLLLRPQDAFGLYVAYNAEGDGTPRDDLERALVARYFNVPPNVVSPFAPRPADAAAVAGWYEHTRRAETNLFSVEELFTQWRVKAGADGSIKTGVAGWFAKNPTWTVRREIAPYIFEAPDGDKWAFETKNKGLEILENTDGTYGRERVAWYSSADFIQPLMAASLAAMVLALLCWPGVALSRRAGLAKEPVERSGIGSGAYAIPSILFVDLGVVAAVIYLVRADWDQQQIFVDALDPWLLVLYVGAWFGVLTMPVVIWIAYRSWSQSNADLFVRIHHTMAAVAILIAAWFAVAWHIAGTTLNY